jgi:peroxiredoxin
MVMGQAPSSVKLSNASPEAGKSLILVYTPTATVLEGKSPISVMAYYWKDVGEPDSHEIKSIANSNTLRMEIRVPDSVKVFALKFFNGENVDANNGKGYIYPIYQNGQVVQDAMAIMSKIYLWGDYNLSVEENIPEANKFMQRELEKFPSLKKDFLIIRIFLLVRSENEEDKALLEKELYSLLQSNEEREWEAARYFFSQINNVAVADSLEKAIPKKFPNGELARRATADKIYEEKDAKKMELLYKAWVKKFPPPKPSNQLEYDYVRGAVANAFAKENNLAKALEYANMIQTKSWRGEGYAGVADILMKNGHYTSAKDLLKRAIDNAHELMTTSNSTGDAPPIVIGYSGYNNMYAETLYKEKKYGEALTYVQKAFENDAKPNERMYSNYAKILIALNRDREALEKIEEVLKMGHATSETTEMSRSLYVKIKGSNAGYGEYMDSLKKILAVKVKEDLRRKMINQPAPMFVLKDLNGNTVSLQDLKGKTVILDFWATWCAPCIRSFPAMKRAVNKYKDDPNVKFLFIHTMETAADATTHVKKFIENNDYGSFQVLMDLKNPDTGSNPVVESFKVNGIPAKFVIDKNGNIRFSLAGFDGNDDAAVEEIIAMIELAQK